MNAVGTSNSMQNEIFMVPRAASNWRETRQNGLPRPERTFTVYEGWIGRFNAVGSDKNCNRRTP